MQNTRQKPSVFVAWLGFERREAIAIWLRDKAAGLAEWVCPELKDQAK